MAGLRVLQILTRPNLGGPTRHLRALLTSAPWRDRPNPQVEVLLATGTCPEHEATSPWDDPRIVRIDTLGPELHPLRDRRARAALVDLIQRFRPDVVHTHTSKAGHLGRRAALAAGVPVLAHTFHGHVLKDYFQPLASAVFRAMERRHARRTHLLFAVSPSCRDELEALGVGRGRIQVLPPAVPLDAFRATTRKAARQALGIHDGRPLVGFAGRMVPVKQPHLFAAMARELPPGVAAVMFGDGPLLADLRQAHQDRILFPGAVADLHRYLPALDVLVLTSRREGCPLAALEARACGVAVVGLDRPGIADALGGGRHGLLVPPEAGVPGLVAAVADLLADAPRRRDLVAAGHCGLERHDPARIAQALTTSYRQARGAVTPAGAPA